ncbi:hypothetical protein IUY40_18860 [Flavobacterium sp. ALJ2]|uniref:hypothetical protein n=1 Tax=Flavobacterium sp. ALJ2 TaxID=2786960 RepID=UPI00189D4B62|nr:hypothetical protein [Flavobacterium sp. ALJ2]MBF7093596.1 hypothetical protein [Flavobacterium sp. ALJ2]
MKLTIKKTTIKPIRKKLAILELQKQGFVKTQISGLFVTNKGDCYNHAINRKLLINKAKITIKGKAYNVAKIILETFCKIPIRNGQIRFKNGNNKDYSLQNLEYATTETHHAPKETDIIKVIRLYFEVPKKMSRQNLIYKFYLHEIAIKRGFVHSHTGKYFDLFLQWLNPFSLTQNQSKQEISVKNGYSITNGINAINEYLNLLTNDCLRDFENGFLHIKDFAPKQPTKTQKLKELQKTINANGLNIKIPLRKSSAKEKLNQYLKQINHLKNN